MTYDSYEDLFYLAPGETRAKVAAGAAWLDEHRPGWWLPDRFDRSRFSLADAGQCVIDQVYAAEGIDLTDRYCSNFYEAINDGWLGLTFDLAEELGFYIRHGERYPDEYAQLDVEWRHFILIRQAVMSAAFYCRTVGDGYDGPCLVLGDDSCQCPDARTAA